MPRRARLFEPGLVYHLIPRFVENRWFMMGVKEREAYLRLLGRSLPDSDWRLISYGLMSSHIHLELIAGEQPLKDWLQRVHTPFADMINRTNKRIGPVFVRGPAAHVTPMDRVGELLAYIHNNPVRASVVRDPRQSTWTSHRAYLGLEHAPPWLHIEEGMRLSRFASREALATFVALAPEDPSRASVERLKREPGTSPQQFRAARLAAQVDIDAGLLVEVVARELAVPIADLRCTTRTGERIVGRRVVARCARSLGIPGKAVAKVLGITQQAVSASLHRGSGAHELTIAARVCARLRERQQGSRS